MNWNGEEYSRRLEGLSHNTMLLISEFNTIEDISKAADIIMETASEKEIVKKLLQSRKKDK